MRKDQSSPKSIILNNAVLLSFPFSVVSPHIGSIERDLKEYLGHIAPYSFVEFVRMLSVKYLKENRIAYSEITKEIYSNLIKNIPKITSLDLLTCLEVLQNIPVAKPQIVNTIFDVANFKI
jgi:hypothetical protein